jgi:hypothetical protein
MLEKMARAAGETSNPDAIKPDELFKTLEEWNKELERLGPLPLPEPSL